MSEAIPGMPAAPAPLRPKDAAAVVMFRSTPQGPEVFWLRRERTLAFAGGFYAFPGGGLDASDAQVPVEGLTGPDAGLVACAAREVFEETGVLLARGAERLARPQLDDLRRGLLDRKVGFAQLLAEHRLTVTSRDFRPAGRWITPPSNARRFDARFFLVEAPPGAEASHWPGELAEAAWIRPQDALKRWEEGTALLHPPNLFALQVLAELTTPEVAAELLSHPPHCPGGIATRIEFQRGFRVYPLETPTLPPATHTNCYLLGNGELLIVDPGSPAVRQYARLLALVAGLKVEGKIPKAIFLTHHHADHVGAVVAVKQRLGIPVWAHVRTAERLPSLVDRMLEDGEVIQLGGVPPMRFKVLHTPGHARGHLCLVDEATRSAVVGDMVAGVGTIVIDPPEGDMADYLAQLKRLRELPVAALYPAHGPVIPDGPVKLMEYLQHREMRERLVIDAVPKQGATLAEIVKVAYADTPEFVHPIAERSAQAILIKLVRESLVYRKEDRYFGR